LPARSIHEAVPATKSEVLDQVLAAAVVDGDSAFPVAVDKGYVLLSKSQDITAFGGQIIAVVTREGEFSTAYFAYLKHLGKQMPGIPSVYYLENVGQSGEGEYVQFSTSGTFIPRIPIVLDTWRVLGTILG
jgi:hypothetical protein